MPERLDRIHARGVLRTGGHAIDESRFEPFFAFRFPEGGGVSRSVDATVERVQLTVSDLVEDRYVISCNSRRMPLQPKREADVQVAGVRFKAWAHPSSLNPQLPINAPLVFDVIDTARERSVGGCKYHVAHPGGRNCETFPVNENEAEGRKLARSRHDRRAAAGVQSRLSVHARSQAPALKHRYRCPHDVPGARDFCAIGRAGWLAGRVGYG